MKTKNSTKAVDLNDFMKGVESEVARDYWLDKFEKEFESQSDDEYIQVIHIFNKILKSDMAKEYWQKDLYTEEEVEKLIYKCWNKAFQYGINEITCSSNKNLADCNTWKEWFENNKKK